MVEGEEVLGAEVYAELLDEDLLRKFLRKRVADGEVLDSQIGQVVQVLGLGREVVAAGVAGQAGEGNEALMYGRGKRASVLLVVQ